MADVSRRTNATPLLMVAHPARCLRSLALGIFISSIVLPFPSFAQTPSSQATTLTADQVTVLSKLLNKYGKRQVLAKRVTDALGMTKGDERATVLELVAENGPVMHAYIPLPDGGLFLGLMDAGNKYYDYRLDVSLTLVAAVSTSPGQPAVAIPMADAERDVRTQLAYWAHLSDIAPTKWGLSPHR